MNPERQAVVWAQAPKVERPEDTGSYINLLIARTPLNFQQQGSRGGSVYARINHEFR